MNKDPQGEPGQIHVLVRDQESEITSHGKHNRLLVFRPVDAPYTISIREDILHGLPMSTEEDRQRVARGYQRLHPKGTSLRHASSSAPYPSFNGSAQSIEHTYLVCRAGKPLGEVLELKLASGSIILMPEPMARMPSARPADWLKFQRQHVPGTTLCDEDQNRVQAFMRQNRTEALTDGNRFYTLAGGMLAYCEPSAIQ